MFTSTSTPELHPIRTASLSPTTPSQPTFLAEKASIAYPPPSPRTGRTRELDDSIPPSRPRSQQTDTRVTRVYDPRSPQSVPPHETQSIPLGAPPDYELAVRLGSLIHPPRVSSRDRAATSTPPDNQILIEHDPPPPFATPGSPAPGYGERTRADTLSEFLFWHGFFFPLFWFIGAMVIVIELSPTPEEECGQTAEEQKEALDLLRQTELKWAYRCLYALAAFAVVLTGTIVGLVIGTR